MLVMAFIKDWVGLEVEEGVGFSIKILAESEEVEE